MEPIVGSFTVTQVNRLLTLLVSLGAKDDVRNICALRLHQLGHTEEAVSILEPILNKSAASGWSPHWDGGTRVYALKALIAIDPQQWRPRALEMLIDDYIREFRYPFNLLNQIEELADLLFEEIPWDQLWPEIREHVFQLADFSLSEEQPPLYPESVLTASDVLLRTISWAAELPINELRDQTQNALCEIEIKGLMPSATKALITSMLAGKKMTVVQGLALLETVWRQGSQLASEFTESLLGLCGSPDYVVRKMAVTLIEVMGVDVPDDDGRKTAELPTTYRIQFPPLQNRESVVPDGTVRPGEVFPDSTDPLEMIRPHNEELELLSDITGIPFENLLERTAVLMRSIEPETNWNRAAEEQMRDLLGDIGLNLTYNRHRPQIALRAISHVVSELADAKRINGRALEFVFNRLTLYEWRLSGKEPIIRPHAICPPEKPKGFGHSEAWINDLDPSSDYFANNLDDGFVVLGELSRFKEWSWETPTEWRLSMGCHPDQPSPTDTDEINALNFFPFSSFWRAKDYPVLSGAENEPSLVVYGSHRQVLIGAIDWLAIHPSVAMSLDWRLAEDGLFRWVDENGAIMVESRWWQDGPLGRQPPRSREITGEGWLVVASPVAISIIIENIKPLSILRAVKRTYAKDQQDEHKWAQIVEECPWPASD